MAELKEITDTVAKSEEEPVRKTADSNMAHPAEAPGATRVSLPGGQKGQSSLTEFGIKKKKVKKGHLKPTVRDAEVVPPDNEDWPEDSISLMAAFGKKKSRKGDPLKELTEEMVERGDDLYKYDFLLRRVRDRVLQEKENRANMGQSDKVIIPIPQVVRTGKLRTSFVNFLDTVNKLHRSPHHLLTYLNAELGTSCTVCSTNQLWIRGNFKPKHIEKVLRDYIESYVLCPACRSGRTLLTKRERMTFLNCDRCEAKFKVSTISNGYRANIRLR